MRFGPSCLYLATQYFNIENIFIEHHSELIHYLISKCIIYKDKKMENKKKIAQYIM